MATDHNPQAGDRIRGRITRRGLAMGGAAAVVVLGGGAYLLTTTVADRHASSPAGGPAALAPVAAPVPSGSGAPVTPAATASGSVAPASARPPKPATTSKAASLPAPTSTKSAAEIRKEITAAREKAAAEGHPLQRALVATATPAHDAGSYSEHSYTLPGGGTMRVSSAKYDLSGSSEMLMAADQGQPVGDARCTQNFRFSQGGQGSVRPSMMLCWRTSYARSVVVLTVAKRPSAADSVARLYKQWNSLG